MPSSSATRVNPDAINGTRILKNVCRRFEEAATGFIGGSMSMSVAVKRSTLIFQQIFRDRAQRMPDRDMNLLDERRVVARHTDQRVAQRIHRAAAGAGEADYRHLDV